VRPVWIDLANSPHVLFFAPVIEELRRRQVEVVVTARDFAQTLPLCRRLGIEAEPIGGHGAGLSAKAASIASRAAALRVFGRRLRPAVAVSHNSYAHALAARSLGVPVVTAMDYEFQPANHVAFRCARLVAVPDVYPLDRLRAQGARPHNVWRYHGLKEHIALAGFRPDPEYLREAGVADGRPVVVARPPATMALYHRFENPLFVSLLERMARDETLRVVVLPRTPEQSVSLDAYGLGHVLWRGEALDGRQLVAGADAVISAGGSMNREAAVLGTPAFSVYAGKLAAVDRALVAAGRLTLIGAEGDVEDLRLAAKPTRAFTPVSGELLISFCHRLLAVAQ
jgi:predicted glycosyltransferase